MVLLAALHQLQNNAGRQVPENNSAVRIDRVEIYLHFYLIGLIIDLEPKDGHSELQKIGRFAIARFSYLQ